MLVLLTSCGGQKTPSVISLRGGEELSLFKLYSLGGTRDGDRLAAQAVFSDSSSILTIQMNFAVGSPTKLDVGVWQWTRSHRVETGTVSGRSVTFLGGQDGPPSIGGVFDLLDSSGAPEYRVTIPVRPLKGH